MTEPEKSSFWRSKVGAQSSSGWKSTPSLKYEWVYLHAFETGSAARAGIGKWIDFYNY
ncbi:hypothetical protein [Phaeobacter piscinae]|uniref:hypothetical protein n=1 Tax=Phaeobacter piscinae TaxID=1580596 RepID=UPI0013149F07|nr:hypothetical protein [Phaeobacter piscinae]